MNLPVIHSSGERDTVLHEALDRQTPVVLSFRHGGEWSTFKSQILSLDLDRDRMSVAVPPDQAHRLGERLQEGQYVGMAFRRGHKKCLCTCVVTDLIAESANREHARSLVLHWPKEIQVLQRRDYHRVPIPPNMAIKVLIWPGAITDKPEHPGQDRSSLYATIVDLSLGGLAVHLPAHEDCRIVQGRTVSCEFTTPEGGRITLEAQFRHSTRKPNGDRLLGFQFLGLEHGPQGRRRIKQLVGLTRQLTHRRRPPFRRGLSRRREPV